MRNLIKTSAVNRQAMMLEDSQRLALGADDHGQEEAGLSSVSVRSRLRACGVRDANA
jgi:hypothetical protein